MTKRAARGWWWVGTLLGACNPNVGGMGSGTANTLGTPDDTGETTAATTEGGPVGSDTSTTSVEPAETTDATTTSAVADSTTGDPPPSTTGEPQPLLSLSDGPTFEFGDVTTGDEVAHVFTLANQGDAPAQGLGATIEAPFALPGGFPRDGGSCGPSLAAGDSCTIEVVFSPTEFGRHVGTLVVTHDGGPEVAVDVEGGAIGQSEPLLVNGGGESFDAPPPGWTEQLGSWEANVYPMETEPFEGDGYLLAGTGPSGEDLALVQDVDVSAWATTSDQGRLQIAFSGYARALAADDDEHRIRLRWLDENGATLAIWGTDYHSELDWQPYTEERLAPAGTRTVQVELNCRKPSGPYCYAYFDALELRASYP